jgi:hypothetical protein
LALLSLNPASHLSNASVCCSWYTDQLYPNGYSQSNDAVYS